MPIDVSVQANGPTATVAVKGALDSSSQATFKQQLEPVLGDSSVSEIKLDFSGLQSIESSSSGMLMFLNHSAKAKNKTVGIANANPDVLAQLHKANLGKVMTIH
jgi:anti-anti-sigma factor